LPEEQIDVSLQQQAVGTKKCNPPAAGAIQADRIQVCILRRSVVNHSGVAAAAAHCDERKLISSLAAAFKGPPALHCACGAISLTSFHQISTGVDGFDSAVEATDADAALVQLWALMKA
jgi:hypothetical protein